MAASITVRATSSVPGGGIISVSWDDNGSGYLNNDILSLIQPGASGATVKLIIPGGSHPNFLVTLTKGTGYNASNGVPVQGGSGSGGTVSIVLVTPTSLYDPVMGQGQGNFLSDKDAVAQKIRTRLLLFEGEWWENLSEGLPLWQRILGYGGAGRSQKVVSFLIQSRIVGTPFVEEVSNVQTSYDPSTRVFQYSAQVKTAFGPITVTNIPTPPDKAITQ